MRKSKLYIILSILTVIFLFGTAAICSQCSQNEEPPEEEPPGTEPVETPPDEKPPEEKPPPVEVSVPTIKLSILEGYPKYLEESSTCYYRIEAEVTGSPTPDVVFSQDDSGGSWGDYIAQVNIASGDEVIILTATATNTEGSYDASIELSWECDEEPPSGGEPPDDDGDGVVFESPETELTFTPSQLLNPSDIGYVLKDLGFAWSELYVGDLTSDTDARGFFAFDLSSLAGKEITSATLILDRPDDETRGNPIFKGKILLYFNDYLPLNRDDYEIHPYEGPITFENNEVPLEYSSEYLASIIQERANEGKKIQFALAYENSGSDDDGEKDGRYYGSDNIILAVKCSD